MNKKSIMGLSIFFLLVFSVSTFAQPTVWHKFWGEVTINGNPAPDGVLITAKINGVDVAGTTTLNGNYGLEPSVFYVPDPLNNNAGDNVEFFVNDQKSGEAVYRNGGSDAVNLAVDIHPFCGDGIVEGSEDCNSCPADAGSCAPPGGGGGGGGGSPPTVTCTENWVCTDWFLCSDGEQTRVCSDTNNCGTIDNKPVETQTCLITCEDGETKCDGNDILICRGGNFVFSETCEFACVGGECRIPEGDKITDSSSDFIGTPTSNPLSDFFNSIFESLFPQDDQDGLTGAVTGGTLGIIGAVILVIILGIIVLVLGRKK